ncbi:MAG: hypothetical protein MK080_08410 [Opitutales bacterium]|nr:hypothetical protein [Opitutales bacterium]
MAPEDTSSLDSQPLPEPKVTIEAELKPLKEQPESAVVDGPSDTELEAMYLGEGMEEDDASIVPNLVVENKGPTPQYTADECDALAKKLLPEDVYAYFKAEFRGQFTDVRHIDDKPVY